MREGNIDMSRPREASFALACLFAVETPIFHDGGDAGRCRACASSQPAACRPDGIAKDSAAKAAINISYFDDRAASRGVSWMPSSTKYPWRLAVTGVGNVTMQRHIWAGVCPGSTIFHSVVSSARNGTRPGATGQRHCSRIDGVKIIAA